MIQNLLDSLQTSIIDCQKVELSEIDFSDCEDLTIWHFNPKSRSLKDLPQAKYIKSLKIYHTNITDLAGLDRFEFLKNLELAYCRNLSSLSGIPCGVSFLMVEHAPNLANYDILAQMKNIEVLRLHECGNIPDLSFLSGMNMLREFRFVNTSISDGNLQPLIDHSPKLEALAFNNKRYYSHLLKQIHRILGISF